MPCASAGPARSVARIPATAGNLIAWIGLALINTSLDVPGFGLGTPRYGLDDQAWDVVQDIRPVGEGDAGFQFEPDRLRRRLRRRRFAGTRRNGRLRRRRIGYVDLPAD